MVCLAKETICKPLNEREHKFYKTMGKTLIPFVPRYEGTMRVEVHEDDLGIPTSSHVFTNFAKEIPKILCFVFLRSTDTPPLTRFFGPGKNRVKGKPCYWRSVLVLKPKNGELENSKSTF